MSDTIKDSYEQALDEQILILKACQQKQGMKSCFNCEKLFNCSTRQDYVNAVYNSMSKGKNEGGFDF